MKKIFVMAYLKNNLGDDLFVSELVKRYKNVDFFIDVVDPIYAKAFKENDNVKVMLNKKENFDKIDIERYDGFVYIGGSIFMEGGKVYNLDETCLKFINRCNDLKKPFYYISSNYGPYKTADYFSLSRKVFKKCTDLCFRDKYSYNLFKDIPTIRYAPDLLFSYDIGKCEKEKNTIGISVIDLEIRENFKNREKEYIDFLTSNIINYINEGNKVYLFSFCRQEGDEKAIDKIVANIKDEKYIDNIYVVNYDGDIEKFLEVYKKMEYMLCQRFHSLILSYICKQKFYVISYSKKIDNIIDELNLCDEYVKLDQINSNKSIDLKEFFEVETNKLEIIKKSSLEQFIALDAFLGKGER